MEHSPDPPPVTIAILPASAVGRKGDAVVMFEMEREERGEEGRGREGRREEKGEG